MNHLKPKLSLQSPVKKSAIFTTCLESISNSLSVKRSKIPRDSTASFCSSKKHFFKARLIKKDFRTFFPEILDSETKNVAISDAQNSPRTM